MIENKELLPLLLEGLKQIKENGGHWFDFIENDNGLIDDNYELAMLAIGWDCTQHTEKQFDDKMCELFDSNK